MKITEIKADIRAEASSSSARALRRSGFVPGVLYGGGKNFHFAAQSQEIRKLIYTSDFGLVDLNIDGETHRCIVKDYQLHPVTDNIEHVDMLALTPGKTIKVELPVHFVGVAPGVKAGGTVVKKLRKVMVKTTPDNLISEFNVDISDLELGQSVRVRDIVLQEGMEVLNPGPIPLATIEIPRALKSAAAAAEEEEGETTEEGAPTEGEEPKEGGGDE